MYREVPGYEQRKLVLPYFLFSLLLVAVETASLRDIAAQNGREDPETEIEQKYCLPNSTTCG